jgi:hypothetical protein
MSGPRDADRRGDAGGTRPALRAEDVAERVRRLVDQFRRELASGEAHDIKAEGVGDIADLLARLRTEPPPDEEIRQARPGTVADDPSELPGPRWVVGVNGY